MFNHKTTSYLAEHLSRKTRPQLDHFLGKHGVPTELFAERPESYSKLKLAGEVLKDLTRRKDFTTLKSIAQAILQEPSCTSLEHLESALTADGFTVTDGKIEAGPVSITEERSALETIIERNPYLSQDILHHHLKQNINLYTDGKWDASIAQARNFIEQLLHDIAMHLAKQRSEKPDLDKPLKVRNYLVTVCFLQKNEREKLIDGVYGYLSEEGAHPGISEQKVAHVCRILCLTIGQYLIEKLENYS